jgi:hypothetical protein
MRRTILTPEQTKKEATPNIVNAVLKPTIKLYFVIANLVLV